MEEPSPHPNRREEAPQPGMAYCFRMSARAGWHDWIGILGVLVVPLVSGCAPTKIRSTDRLDKGFVIVLPGIEGVGYLNANVAKGLSDGGIPSAIEVYDWTAGPFFMAPVTLRASSRNKRQAHIIADKIMAYQDQYPDRPVHLVGHSGGGGMAVMALEALPPDRTITGAILLAPALSPDYDLRRALRRTEFGIYNYYSPYDMAFLKAGTTIMGTIDGRHTSAAGSRGFTIPWGLDKEDRRLYQKLYQQRYARKMADSGHGGGHTGWARRRFVAEWLAPIIYSQIDAKAEYAADVRQKEDVGAMIDRASTIEATSSHNQDSPADNRNRHSDPSANIP